MTEPASTPAPVAAGGRKKTLAAVIGSIAGAAALFVMVPAEESGRTVAARIGEDGSIALTHVDGRRYLKAYLDIVGVPTACDGITRGVKFGRTYTEVQCSAMLEEELIAHAEPLMKCAPRLYGRGNQAAATVSLTYNMGVAAICGSTVVRRINAGDWRGAADGFLGWNKVTVPAGQVAGYRRRAETCAAKKTGGWSCTVKGLTARRGRERTLFLKELPR